ncbi:hypothetical protein JRQ81_001363 [Phrynocephalus forsythii]|uniref:Dapper homolog 1 n=1 Tax=Phrynocephalus forsythii TaxID=171643 RepID=A0A9Q0Y7U4_9SAUR|nr:hypothetical protein JRQ81_001363 [Phrynocephalus forsythii]
MARRRERSQRGEEPARQKGAPKATEPERPRKAATPKQPPPPPPPPPPLLLLRRLHDAATVLLAGELRGAGSACPRLLSSAPALLSRRDEGERRAAAATTTTTTTGGQSGDPNGGEPGVGRPLAPGKRRPERGDRSGAAAHPRAPGSHPGRAGRAGVSAAAPGVARQAPASRRRLRLVSAAVVLAPAAEEAPAEAGIEPAAAAKDPRSLEERFLEENILLLRRQLNCLRRRDAGLLNQLQELDKQISDLRLDVEKTADEHLETDSRPSSDLIGWLEYNKGVQHEDQTTGMVTLSPSTPYPNALDVLADVHPKYQCDLVSKNGNDVYRYPSPLHAVAVQSPMFLLPATSSLPRDEEEKNSGSVAGVCPGADRELMKPSASAPPSNSPAASCPITSRKMDGYILSLVQKKTPSVRTNKPRTNLNADPIKGILRHGSLCVRQLSAATHSNTLSLKILSPAPPPAGGTALVLDNGVFPPLKQHTKEKELPENKRMPLPGGSPPNGTHELQAKLPLRSIKPPESTRGSVANKGDLVKESGQTFGACLKESPCRHTTPLKDNKAAQFPKKMLFQNSGVQASPSQEVRPPLAFKSEGLPPQSLDEALLVNAQYVPAQPPTVRLHKGSRSVRVLKSSLAKHRPHLVTVLENGPPIGREKGKSRNKKCRFPEDPETAKKPKKAATRGRRSNHVLLEATVQSRPPGILKSALRPHGREPVVAKPKHKRGDYRRWKLPSEASYEEALRRARRSRREGAGVCSQAPHPYSSPYAYVASDSEYSAECESLFHSTVVDTSEDEKSNYTTNCFGDSESSLSGVEFVGESTATSDSDESGGFVWSQFVQTLPIQAVAAASELHENAAKTFVKIKASHNLKKKILRFRSGSLKLMTTV